MKILHKHTSLFVLAVLIISLITGCVKNEDFDFSKVKKGEWNPDLAVPLIHSDLTINDITGMTDTGMFAINGNHQVSLIYKQNVYKISGYEFFTPINLSDLHTIQLTAPDSVELYVNNSVSRSINYFIPLTFQNGEQIDSMTVRKGNLRMNLTSNIPHNAVLNVILPDATLNGIIFNKNIPINAAAGFTEFAQGSFDLSGYHISMRNAGMPNFLNVIYTLTFQNSGTASNTLNQNFDIMTSFDSIAPASIFGYLGQREFIIPSDSAQISIFNNFQSGSTYFEDPVMTMTLSNSFGMPIDAQLSSLFAILPDGSTMTVNGPVPSPMIDYPLSFGQTVTNSFVFDNTNSNIQQVVNANPKYIVYDISAGTNSPLPTYNFMSDSSMFKADLQIEFPLKGYASGFTIEDTVNFSIGNINEITSVDFRLNVSNGFPVHAFTQLYFTDDNYTLLDSLFTTSQDRIVEAAPVDVNGKVTTPTVRSADELFDGVRLQHLFDAKKILIKGIVETTSAPASMIEIFDYYKLDFKLGVRTKLKIQF